MNQSLTKYVHSVLQDHLKPTSICLDATCGNGHDTLFLAQNCKHVYAFDIQEQAIQSTAKILEKHTINNVSLYQASHALLLSTLPKAVQLDIIVYNLGYLPHGSKNIITKPTTTITSIQQALQLLQPHGLIAISVYVGHEGGRQESIALKEYVSALDKHDYLVIQSTYLNRHLSPYVIFIQKA